MGLSGSPLILQPVYAWPYGPVIPALYHALKRFGGGRISGRAVYFDPEKGWLPFHEPIGSYPKAVIDAIWSNYGSMSGNQLVTLTHQRGTPWEQVTRGRTPDQIRDLPIPDEVIQRYYRDLALKNRDAQNVVSPAPAA